MKKLLNLLLTCMMLLAITGCSTVSFSSADAIAPWRKADVGRKNTEISVYKIVKRDQRVDDASNDEGGIVGEGYLIFTISAVMDGDAYAHVPAEGETKEDRDILTAQMYITYNDKADKVLQNKTDRIESAVIFNARSYAPRYSTRTVEYERGEDENGNAYQNDSLTVTTDYIKRETVNTCLSRVFNETTSLYELKESTETMDFSDAKAKDVSSMIDNELLYHYVRALDIQLQVTATDTNCMSGFTALLSCGGAGSGPTGGMGTLKLCNPLDMLEDGKFFTYSLSYTCATDATGDGYDIIHVGDNLKGWGADAEGMLATVETTLSVTSGRTGNGNALLAYYSAAPLTKRNNDSVYSEKVLIQTKFTEHMRYNDVNGAYNLMDITEKCTTTQTLCDFYYGDSPASFDLTKYSI